MTNSPCYFCGASVHTPAYNPAVPEVCKYHWRKLCTVAPPHIVKSFRRYLRPANPHNYTDKMNLEEAFDALKLYLLRIEKGLDTN
jgi:hypothetical protein